jgi:hypothetical protein
MFMNIRNYYKDSLNICVCVLYLEIVKNKKSPTID